MAERLGIVLYWVGIIAAAALAAGAYWVVNSVGDYSLGFIAFVSWPALLAWLAGKAAHYVLAGNGYS